jgi:hypothetical protein
MTRALSKKWERSSGMNWLSELARRLNMLLQRRRFDADLEEEMRLHLELRRLEQLVPAWRATRVDPLVALRDE